MKVILSRKGFDSASGGMCSPILPDGTLLSLPIPDDKDINNPSFGNLNYNDKSYKSIIYNLNNNFDFKRNSKCHLDPDIRKNICTRAKDWIPAFGQSGTSQTHLENNNVQVGDIFLFWGLYKETEEINNLYKFKHNSKKKHIIFAYMQIGEIIKDQNVINTCFPWHPHAFRKNKNIIYVPSKTLSLYPKLKGYGLLNYDKKRILTKDNLSSSKWQVPSFFKNLSITYHNANNFKEDYFQSASRGQEFIISSKTNTDEKSLLNWVLNIIT